MTVSVADIAFLWEIWGPVLERLNCNKNLNALGQLSMCGLRSMLDFRFLFEVGRGLKTGTAPVLTACAAGHNPITASNLSNFHRVIVLVI